MIQKHLLKNDYFLFSHGKNAQNVSVYNVIIGIIA